ncbi:MAG: efflux RND transporter periplasmic adaptor subunit [Acidimicrobiia bacterium]|nr:efflux RND transporter periplasmic adaptor subunit [Acidimicrobiia bacterium]
MVETMKITMMAALVLTGLTACEQPPPPQKPIRPVLSQLVEVKADWKQSTYAGQVKARYETPLSFRIGGKVIDRQVDVGDNVEADATLAQLDPADYELELVEAEARGSAAKAEKDKAESDLERHKKLLKRELISSADYTDFTNKLNVAKARLRQAEAELEVARNRAVYTALKADHAGVVTAVEIEKGQVVAAGQTVLRLALEGKKEVVIAVPENRLVELNEAQEIRISLWANPDRSYEGRLREISPGADPITRTYSAKITLLDAGPAVQLGMTATVIMVRQRGEGEVVRLPLSAIYQQETGDPAVWLVNADNRIDLAPVEVAEYTFDEVLIRSGLAAGQRVVTAGVHKLTSGQQVRVAEGE